MWLDNASQDAVDEFWRLCGESEPFPRTLERSIALALPVALVKLPRLRLSDIEYWIRRRGVVFQFGGESRQVRGCLVAFAGKGVIFIDGTDPDDELRFTLAHEVAHFMKDYLQLRNRAIEKLGSRITEVIDGYRSANVTERVYSLLGNVPIGVHIDLLERASVGSNPDLWKIENIADKIALALLAPPQEVFARVDFSHVRFDDRHTNATRILCDHFGLPYLIARAYSRSLLDSIGKGPSWVEGLRLK